MIYHSIEGFGIYGVCVLSKCRSNGETGVSGRVGILISYGESTAAKPQQRSEEEVLDQGINSFSGRPRMRRKAGKP